MCRHFRREVKLWLATSFIFLGLFIAGCILVGVGMGTEDKTPNEIEQKLTLAGFIILLLLFVASCTACVMYSHRNDDNNVI